MVIRRSALAILLILSVSFSAYAQPELKVGQEIEFYSKGASPFRCKIKSFSTRHNTKYADCNDEHGTSMPLETEHLTGYRILKPAPRPEFKLPHRSQYSKEKGLAVSQNENFIAIADELRWLRKKLEAH